MSEQASDLPGEEGAASPFPHPPLGPLCAAGLAWPSRSRFGRRSRPDTQACSPRQPRRSSSLWARCHSWGRLPARPSTGPGVGCLSPNTMMMMIFCKRRQGAIWPGPSRASAAGSTNSVQQIAYLQTLMFNFRHLPAAPPRQARLLAGGQTDGGLLCFPGWVPCMPFPGLSGRPLPPSPRQASR